MVGDHAGFNGHGQAFIKSRIGHFTSLRGWRHRVWLVAREELNDKLVDEHAIILPHLLLDPDSQPNARRWLAEQPLVCVSGMKVQRLKDAGLRVFTVEMGVEGDSELRVRAEGGERATWELRGPLEEFLPEELRVGVDRNIVRAERREVRTLVDRLLDYVSRGTLREASVCNAMAARTLVEPGYGYHGATDGTAIPVGRVQQKMRGLEALFEQVYERASPMRDDAYEIERAVTRAPGDAEEIEVPVFDRAHRELLAEMNVRLDGVQYIVDGEPQEELVLPELARWIVRRVASWTPKLPSDVEAALDRDARRPPPPLWIAMLLVAVLVAFIVVGLIMQAAP